MTKIPNNIALNPEPELLWEYCVPARPEPEASSEVPEAEVPVEQRSQDQPRTPPEQLPEYWLG